MKKSKILVHICCAPDAIYFLKRLREDFPESEIVGYFYDPNIHPYEEYKLRYIETERICRELGIKLIEGEYDVENWLQKVKGYEHEPERGARCELCFDHRLRKSVEVAKELGCNYLTTTLLMSPKKSIPQLKKAGEEATKDSSVIFLALDYRKGGGTQEMFKLSKDRDLYQQDYCGCIYGLFKQRDIPVQWDLVSFKGRRPGSKEERLFIKEVRLFVEELNLPAKEYEFPFLNWKVLEGKIEVDKEVIPSYVLPYSQSIRGVAKGKVEHVNGDKLFLNKQNVKIILSEPFRDLPLRVATTLISPTFIVPAQYREKLLSGKIVATLKTEFVPDRSEVLIIGSEKAREFWGIPADTLQDGKGTNINFLRRLIEDNREKIRKKEVAILLLGAESLGRAGSKFVEDFLGIKVNLICDWS
ncbi:MAG TPA: aminopeptidase [Aquificaceae bacterium]|nr:aminopeptidase [Aquificaceae bacterium]